MKTCTKCGDEKPVAEFYRHIQRRDGRCNQCMVCMKEQRRRHYAEHAQRLSVKNRRWRRTTQYGMGPGRFEQMIEEQESRCAICAEEFTATPHIDHDHACCPGKGSCGSCVRGLLCGPCNRRLAWIEDIAWKHRAERYLGWR